MIFVEEHVAAIVGQPYDLERVIAFDQAVGVVVYRLAGRESKRAAEFSSLRIKCASASLHCSAMRTAIWPSVVRASEYAPPRVCEPR